MERRRVAYISHCALLSGAELGLARLLPSLDDVDGLVILAEHGPLVERLRSDGTRVEVLSLDNQVRSLSREGAVPGFGVIRALTPTVAYAVRLAKLLREIQPQLVVTNSLKATVYGSIAARLARVPVVWHIHDRIEDDYLPRAAVTILRLAARHVPAGIIANSLATQATLHLDNEVRKPLVSVIGNACPLVGAVPRSGKRLCSTPLVIGMVGRLAPWKGQDIFLRAFAQAFRTSDERAVIIGEAMFGESEYAASLVQLATELGIGERVRFAGFVPDPWQEMAAFDILVQASLIPEPFGQVVVEGMALGTCVVANSLGGPAEIITDGTNGLLTPPGDEHALAVALRRLASDDNLRLRLSAAAPSAVQRFSVHAIAAQEQSFYWAVLSDQHQAPRASQ